VSLVSIADLHVVFSGGREAVRGVSLTLREREIVAVVGESGAGKSLTGLALMGLTPAAARVTGSVQLEGRELVGLGDRDMRRIRGARVGMVHQDPMSALNPVWTAGEQVAETLRAHQGLSRKEAAARAVELLARVRLPNPRRVAASYPHELSGGMRQRVVIAIAIACDPAVLVADEPTTALDVTVQAQILDLLVDMRDELGVAILLITHDMGVVAETADRVCVMYAGRIVEEGAVADVLTAPAHHYTRALLASAELDMPRGRLLAIPGSPPPLGGAERGCAFAPRCPAAQADCVETDPPPIEIGGSVARCLHPLVVAR
jgi:oligopeptide/dipeptide ABC transporter ATP-binding protein